MKSGSYVPPSSPIVHRSTCGSQDLNGSGAGSCERRDAAYRSAASKPLNAGEESVASGATDRFCQRRRGEKVFAAPGEW